MTTVPIIHQDPGCHFFVVGGRHLTRLFSHAPVKLVNYDEDAHVITGPGGRHVIKRGASFVVRLPGTYREVMVGQAGDDNHLLLKIG